MEQGAWSMENSLKHNTPCTLLLPNVPLSLTAVHFGRRWRGLGGGKKQITKNI